MAKVLSEFQKRKAERDRKLRERFRELVNDGTAKMVCYQVLSSEFSLTEANIRLILKEDRL